MKALLLILLFITFSFEALTQTEAVKTQSPIQKKVIKKDKKKIVKKSGKKVKKKGVKKAGKKPKKPPLKKLQKKVSKQVVQKKAAQKNEDEEKHLVLKMMDGTQKFISQSWNALNYGVDDFFANEKFENEVDRSYIRVGYGATKLESDPIIYSFDLKIKVDFPNTKKKFKIVFEKDREDIREDQTQRTGAPPGGSSTKQDGTQAVRDQGYNAAVRYVVDQTREWKVYTDVGMKLKLPLDPFTKLRIRRTIPLPVGEIDLVQRFQLYRQDGFREISEINWEWKISDDYSVNIDNSAAWADSSDEFTLYHAVSLFQRLSARRANSYTVSTTAPTKPTIYYDQYTFSYAYRQLLYNTWLFGEVTAGATFPKEKDWQPQRFAGARLDVVF